MKQYGLIAIFVVVLGLTGANGYWLNHTYAHYKTSNKNTVPKNVAKLEIGQKSGIVSSKLTKVDSSFAGEKSGTGEYAYEELDHSKENTDSYTGQLVVATNTNRSAHFLLAGSANLNIPDDALNSSWELDTVGKDTIWQPASCASKPTVLLRSQYVFIDDGKVKADDTYSSYLVYDLSTQKYRYFGGDKFTDHQGKDEKIMFAGNENDSIVFYIDPTDTGGPLAHSATFKHSKQYAPGYIIRRVIDPATMQYTDYKFKYSVPDAVSYFTVGSFLGADGAQTVQLYPDPAGSVFEYNGTIKSNTLTFSAQSQQDAIGSPSANGSDNSIDPELDAKLTAEMPNFLTGLKADPSQKSNFTIGKLGVQGNIQFMTATTTGSTDNGSYRSNFVIYDTSSNTVDALTKNPVLEPYGGGNFVSLGVF